MKTPSKRDQRLAQEIRKVLTRAMVHTPPELGMITLNEVIISDDWSIATVWYSVLGSHDTSQAQLWLDKNQRQWYQALAPLNRKRIPEVRFKYDKRPDVGQAIENMMK